MSLRDRVLALQNAVIAEQVPSGNNPVGPAVGSVDDGTYGTSTGAQANTIFARSGITDFTPTTITQLNKLRRGHFVLHPRWRLQVAHLGGHLAADFPYEWEYVLDDQVLVHMTAADAYSLDEVDTVLPADWATYFGTVSYGTPFPVYTRTPAWYSYAPGFDWVQTADIVNVGLPFYNSLKGNVVAPAAASTRRPFCNAFKLNPSNPAASDNIFDAWGSGTPVWMLIEESGNSNSTVVRLGNMSWSGGFFEWIHAGITNFVGRLKPTETRNINQILNDLATATGDDPAAGSYTWTNILTTANLSETPVDPPADPPVAAVTQNAEFANVVFADSTHPDYRWLPRVVVDSKEMLNEVAAATSSHPDYKHLPRMVKVSSTTAADYRWLPRIKEH